LLPAVLEIATRAAIFDNSDKRGLRLGLTKRSIGSRAGASVKLVFGGGGRSKFAVWPRREHVQSGFGLGDQFIGHVRYPPVGCGAPGGAAWVGRIERFERRGAVQLASVSMNQP
jgi:hypothetical protein